MDSGVLVFFPTGAVRHEHVNVIAQRMEERVPVPQREPPTPVRKPQSSTTIRDLVRQEAATAMVSTKVLSTLRSLVVNSECEKMDQFVAGKSKPLDVILMVWFR